MTDFKKRKTVVKALCLHIAHDCNLACKYCFAEEGEYHGRRALMSLEVGKKALDFLVANSGNRRNLEVDFFGGEPLMNWDVVKELVKYGRSLEKEHNKLVPIEGSPVDMLNPPAGCPFAPRCRACMKICLREMPPYTDLSDIHYSACWLMLKREFDIQQDSRTQKGDA